MIGDFLICAGCYLLAVILSTAAIRKGLPFLSDNRSERTSEDGGAEPEQLCLPGLPTPPKPVDPMSEHPLRAVGFWIGVCEAFLIFVFVFNGAFSALAIVMGAKEFIRKEKIEENPAYYLLGTLLNFAIALGFAVLAQALIAAPGGA